MDTESSRVAGILGGVQSRWEEERKGKESSSYEIHCLKIGRSSSGPVRYGTSARGRQIPESEQHLYTSGERGQMGERGVVNRAWQEPGRQRFQSTCPRNLLTFSFLDRDINKSIPAPRRRLCRLRPNSLIGPPFQFPRVSPEPVQPGGVRSSQPSRRLSLMALNCCLRNGRSLNASRAILILSFR
ncbi:hypothetical protein LZ30DRAFT_112465 [Colletotrichum cereale]|nr:hypothetical protein LZ30DRAFT_112465 [Colletotrichum cereale]